MAAYDDYKTRLPLERKPTEFYLTLHKDTVRDLQNRIVLRELGPVTGADEESDESSEESDEEGDEVKDDQENDPLVPAPITPVLGLRLERMRAALGEEGLRKELRIQFGPRSIADSLAILKKIQMPDRPFAYQGNGSIYNEEWEIQLE